MKILMLMLISSVIILNSHADAKSFDGTSQGRTSLVFSLDQGFGNGAIIQNDQVAVRRIIKALEPLCKQYDVYLLLNPQVGDKHKLENTLDTLVNFRMPFVLDVYTSDSYTLGSCAKHNSPYDCTHALSISIDYLAKLKSKYGKWLSGLRFMEVFGQDFTVRAIKTTNPKWARPDEKLPTDNVFQPKFAEQFIKFAADNKMFLQWADFHWYGAATWDLMQKEYDKQASDLMKKYPGVVIVTYNNNEPNEDSVPKLDIWHNYVKDFVNDGAAGYGLSDQSWLRKDHLKCPPEDIVRWADSALNNGCMYIQFEPVWYFFKLPPGSFSKISYYGKPGWVDRGNPTSNYNTLSEYLLNRKSR